MFQQTKDKASKAADHAETGMSNFKTAKNELKSAKDSAISEAKGAMYEASDKADAKVQNLRDQAREVGEKVQHFLHDRRDELSHAREGAERTIRSNPLATTAGAFLAGAILSRLFKR